MPRKATEQPDLKPVLDAETPDPIVQEAQDQTATAQDQDPKDPEPEAQGKTLDWCVNRLKNKAAGADPVEGRLTFNLPGPNDSDGEPTEQEYSFSLFVRALIAPDTGAVFAHALSDIMFLTSNGGSIEYDEDIDRTLTDKLACVTKIGFDLIPTGRPKREVIAWPKEVYTAMLSTLSQSDRDNIEAGTHKLNADGSGIWVSKTRIPKSEQVTVSADQTPALTPAELLAQEVLD